VLAASSGFDTKPARYCAPRVDARAGIRNVTGQQTDDLRGYVDMISRRRIAGWAQSTAHAEAPICLDIFAGSRLIGRTLANGYRGDLERAAPPIGLAFALDAIRVCRSLDGSMLSPTAAALMRIERSEIIPFHRHREATA
jgi:hypothetical protein